MSNPGLVVLTKEILQNWAEILRQKPQAWAPGLGYLLMALAIVCNLSPEPRLGASDEQFLLNLRQNLSNMYQGIAIGGGEQGWAYAQPCSRTPNPAQ